MNSTYKEFINQDKFISYGKYEWIKKQLLREHEYYIWKFMILLRKEEYFEKRGNPILRAFFRRRKNILGRKLGFTIPANVFGPGLKIWHYGNIVVNALAHVGENCILHGDNCIGNNGKDDNAPIIGNCVDIGVGAKIIGNIYIANNIKIAAGAVVVKSFYEEGITIAGVPAVKVK